MVLVLLFSDYEIHAQRSVEEPPVAGRPEDFSGLVGVFRVSTSASPTDVCVEDPLTLTIRISGTPDRSFTSSRPNRATLFSKQMKEDFFIEPVPDKDRFLEQEKTWEFVYRLRPKHVGVKNVPALKLVYYMPARRKYQSSYADEIALVVKPRPEAVPSKQAIEAARLPARFYELATGAAVLRRPAEQSWLLPVVIVGLLLPPAACAMWYQRWRRLHPDVHKQMHERRSQAAHHALRLLQERPREEQTYQLMATYLRQRFDLACAELTPREVIHHLNRIGISKNLRRKVADLIETCDVARFAPGVGKNDSGIAEEARRIIHALETECQRAAGLTTAARPSRRGDKPRRSPIIPLALFVLAIWTATSSAHKEGHASISDAELLRQAEDEFQKGKEAANQPAEAQKRFAAAARHFAELRKRGVLNPDLFRNLGNAEILAGNLGGAVFAYRSGLRLSPNDGALQENLEYARTRVRYPSPGRPAALTWQPSALVLMLLTLGLYALGCIAWTRRLIKGRGTWRVVVLLGAALLSGAAFAWLWNDRQDERNPPVVIARDATPFYRGNGESYPTHATMPALNEGMETRRLFQRGDWLHIELPGGEVGWVNKSAAVMN